MVRLEKRLEAWRDAGLISGEQLQQIQQFEASQPRNSWGVWGVLGIGATAVITGLVSVVAANWEAIGVTAKLAAYFAVQGTLGFFFYRRHDKPGHVREVLLTGSGLLVLAGIGLIGQVYHLRSDGWQGLLLWLALTLPLVLLAEHRLLPFIWVAGLVVTPWIWAEAFRGALSEGDRILIASAVPVVAAAVGLISGKWTVPQAFASACLVWGMGAVCFGGALFANIAWAEGAGLRGAAPWLGVGIVWLASLSCVIAARVRPGLSGAVRGALSALLLVVALGCTLPLMLTNPPHSDIVGALWFLLIWSLAAALAGLLDLKRLFDLSSVVIALRFVVIYFEVFGSLAATGLGLIVSGAVIIGVALVWHRMRARLRLWMEARR